MPEKKSLHLWIWMTIILLVGILLVVIFFIKKDQKSLNEDLYENMTAPEYNYTEQDRVRIEQDISQSNELFFDAFSGENTSNVENAPEYTVDPAEQEKLEQSNQEFMNMFNQSTL